MLCACYYCDSFSIFKQKVSMEIILKTNRSYSWIGLPYSLSDPHCFVVVVVGLPLGTINWIKPAKMTNMSNLANDVSFNLVPSPHHRTRALLHILNSLSFSFFFSTMTDCSFLAILLSFKSLTMHFVSSFQNTWAAGHWLTGSGSGEAKKKKKNNSKKKK